MWIVMEALHKTSEFFNTWELIGLRKQAPDAAIPIGRLFRQAMRREPPSATEANQASPRWRLTRGSS